uniref:G-protein coupled receptors family 1 profile domain-containing protein n=2 Tax=Plectus sambesii TaxID=2011161 RepID=A0A914X2B6_9BILA
MASVVGNASCNLPNQLFDARDRMCLEDFNFQLMVVNVNSTGDDLQMAMYGTVFPLLVVLVIITNSLVILVLSNHHMTTSTNIVLLYMTVTVLLTGLIPLPFTLYWYTFGNHEAWDQPIWLCYLHRYGMESLPRLLNGITTLLTVLLAAQRFVCVRYPLQALTLCTTDRIRHWSWGAVILTTGWELLTVLANFHQRLYHQYDFDPQLNYFRLRTWCIWKYADFVEHIGVDKYNLTVLVGRVIVFHVAPCFALLVFNIFLIVGIRSAGAQRPNRHLHRNSDHNRTDSKATTIMLVVIISMFLLVNIPVAFSIIILCIAISFDSYSLREWISPQLTVLVPICNMTLVATYPINFAIYLLMSNQFRRTLRRILSGQGHMLDSISNFSMRSRSRRHSESIPPSTMPPMMTTMTLPSQSASPSFHYRRSFGGRTATSNGASSFSRPTLPALPVHVRARSRTHTALCDPSEVPILDESPVVEDHQV